MHALIGNANIASSGLSDGDMAIYLRSDGNYQVLSTHEIDGQNLTSEVVTQIMLDAGAQPRHPTLDEPTDPKVYKGDAGVILRADGNFQIFTITDGPITPETMTDVQKWQGAVLMAFALLMNAPTVMDAVNVAGDGLKVVDNSKAAGLTERQVAQKRAIRAFELVLNREEIFDMVSGMANDPAIAGDAVHIAVKH